MGPSDIDAFFAQREALDPQRYLELDYAFACEGDPREAAAHLCSEQSTAQWCRVGVDEDLRPRFAAKVIDLEVAPPGVASPRAGLTPCRVTVAHPIENFGARLPNLLSAVAGEGVFFVPKIPRIRLVDIRFPDAFLGRFRGPRFGVAGLRHLLGITERPFFFGVIKPNLGLSPKAFSALGQEALLGGLDVVKDDEMLADTPWSPLVERCARLGDARRRAERLTGERKLYLANITDEVDRLIVLHDQAVAHGANAVMLNVLPVGLSAARMMRDHATVPLVAHFPMIAAMARDPDFGVHARVLTLLQRLAGFDVIIMPGFGSRMMTPDSEVMACIDACRQPLGPIAQSLPVPGGSDWAGTLADVYGRVGSVDFGFVPGRGVFSHPDGPRAGAMSIRQAWQAIHAGDTVAHAAGSMPELAAALRAFGTRD